MTEIDLDGITLDPPAPVAAQPEYDAQGGLFGQAEYDAQGGPEHTFWYAEAGGFHRTNVKNHEYVRASWLSNSRMIDEFEASLKEALAQEEIEADVAQTFADIFGISLKREYEFCVTVEFTFTAELGQDDDVDSVVDNLSFSVESGYYSDVEIDNTDYSVQDTSYTEV